jgi:poly(3-hydroxyalkanoate) depolymerase
MVTPASTADHSQPQVNRPAVTTFVEAGDLTLRVSVTKGSDDVTPLLLMNGIGARLELLQPFVDHISDDRDVIRFDVPGVGESPLARKPYRFPHLSRAIGSALDKLGYTGDIDVLGISWGGALAQQFAFTERRRCRRLVLVSTTPGMLMLPAHPKVLLKMVHAKRYTDPEFLATVAGELYGGSMRIDPAAALSAMRSAGSGHNSIGYYMQLLCGLGWTSVPFLPLLKQPTLVLSGSDDPLIRTTNAHILGHLIPHSETIIYEGGHLAMVTEASDIAPLIESFLASPA